MASDNFTRADETPLASPWGSTSGFSSANLSSNKAVAAAGTSAVGRYTTSTSTESTVVIDASATNGNGGPAIHIDTSGNFYTGTGNYFSALTAIIRYDAGAFNEIGNTSGTYGASSTVRIRRSGNDVILSVGGTDVVTATDTTYSGNAPGFNIGDTAPLSSWNDGASSTPTLSSPTVTSITQTSATIGATTDTASGTLYRVLSLTNNVSTATATQIKAGQNSTGSAADFSGNVAVSTTTPSAAQTGLSSNTTYYYAQVQNTTGGDSNVVSGSFTTAAYAGGVPTRQVIKPYDLLGQMVSGHKRSFRSALSAKRWFSSGYSSDLNAWFWKDWPASAGIPASNIIPRATGMATATVVLNGIGSIQASARAPSVGRTQLNGVGALLSFGAGVSVSFAAVTSGSVAGNVTPRAIGSSIATVVVSGTGTLQPAGRGVSISLTATTGIGSLQPAGRGVSIGSAQIFGIGNLQPTGRGASAASASATGIGVLLPSARGLSIGWSLVDFPGAGSFSARGVGTNIAAVQLSAVGSLQPSTVSASRAGVQVSATGSLFPVSYGLAQTTAQMQGVGRLLPLGLGGSSARAPVIVASSTPIWPDPTDVTFGVVYGPTGIEYTGTKTSGGGYVRRR